MCCLLWKWPAAPLHLFKAPAVTAVKCTRLSKQPQSNSGLVTAAFFSGESTRTTVWSWQDKTLGVCQQQSHKGAKNTGVVRGFSIWISALKSLNQRVQFQSHNLIGHRANCSPRKESYEIAFCGKESNFVFIYFSDLQWFLKFVEAIYRLLAAPWFKYYCIWQENKINSS